MPATPRAMSVVAAKTSMRQEIDQDIDTGYVPRKKLIRSNNEQSYPIVSPTVEENTPRGMVKSSASEQPIFCDCDY